MLLLLVFFCASFVLCVALCEGTGGHLVRAYEQVLKVRQGREAVCAVCRLFFIVGTPYYDY